MVVGAIVPWVESGPAILLAGMVALFACSRVLAARVARGELSVGLRAISYFIPIAAASFAAMLLGRPEIAVGVIFGTSVGAMTTVIGFIALAALRSAGLIPAPLVSLASILASFGVVMVLAAVGLNVDLRSLMKMGAKPLLVGLLLGLLMSAVSLGAVLFLGL